MCCYWLRMKLAGDLPASPVFSSNQGCNQSARSVYWTSDLGCSALCSNYTHKIMVRLHSITERPVPGIFGLDSSFLEFT